MGESLTEDYETYWQERVRLLAAVDVAAAMVRKYDAKLRRPGLSRRHTNALWKYKRRALRKYHFAKSRVASLDGSWFDGWGRESWGK